MISSLDRTAKIVVLGVFVALVVDGLDMQMLALALPSIAQEFEISTVMAGALGTSTLLGMGIGGLLAGRLSDRVGRVRVTRWGVGTFTVCTTLIALCGEYWQIAAMRSIPRQSILNRLRGMSSCLSCRRRRLASRQDAAHSVELNWADRRPFPGRSPFSFQPRTAFPSSSPTG